MEEANMNISPLEILKKQIRERKAKGITTPPVPPSPTNDSACEVEDEEEEKYELQSSPYHDQMHTRVEDLAGTGLNICAVKEVVTLKDNDGNLLHRAFVPEPNYNDTHRIDPLDTFLASGANNFLFKVLTSLGCEPVLPAEPHSPVRGIFRSRIITGRISHPRMDRSMTLLTTCTDGSFTLGSKNLYGVWPNPAEIELQLHNIESDLTSLVKLAASLSSQKLSYLIQGDSLVKIGTCAFSVTNGELIIGPLGGHFSQEQWKIIVDTVEIVRRLFLIVKTATSTPDLGTPSMTSEIELA
jgi:hypothetical protein